LPPADRERLEEALRTLRSKIEEAKDKRVELRERILRSSHRRHLGERTKALVEEGKRLIKEGEALPGGEASDARAREIRERLTEIDAEAEALKDELLGRS